MFNKHFRDFFELLEAKNVKFLIIGGYAVGAHGFPRYTGDLDIFIAISEENAQKILTVFADFGFAELGLEIEDFLQEEIVVEIGREPMKIQVLTGIDGVSFEECYATREVFEIDGLSVPFIGFDKLLKNKEFRAQWVKDNPETDPTDPYKILRQDQFNKRSDEVLAKWSGWFDALEGK